MTTVATFLTPEDAHLFRAFLESRGIEGFLLDEYFIQLCWLYSNAIGGVRLSVRDEDEVETAAVYQDYLRNLRAGPYPEAPVRAWPLVLLLSLVLMVPFLIFGRRSNDAE